MHLANSEEGVTFQLIRASLTIGSCLSDGADRTKPRSANCIRSADWPVGFESPVPRKKAPTLTYVGGLLAVTLRSECLTHPYAILDQHLPFIYIHLPQFGVYLNGCFFMSHSIWSPHCCFVISVLIMCWESFGFFRSEKRPTRELSHQGSMENHVVMILVAPQAVFKAECVPTFQTWESHGAPWVVSQSVSLVDSFGFFQLLFPRAVLRHRIRT